MFLIGETAEPHWAVLVLGGVLLAGGIFSVICGIRFRAGQLRHMARYYGDADFPFYARNFSLALIPKALAGCGLGWALSVSISATGALGYSPSGLRASYSSPGSF